MQTHPTTRLRAAGARMLRTLGAALVLLVGATAQDAGAPAWREKAYPEELVEAFRRLPVQDRGRVKPFFTYAKYLLMRLNERSELRLPDEPQFHGLAGEKLGPVEWAMDVLLHPQQADLYPAIVVTDRDVLDRVGLSAIAGRKRDRYSFRDLAAGYDRIFELAREYRQVEEKHRDRLQNQVVYLHQDLYEYMTLRAAFDAARVRLPVGDSELLQAAFGKVDDVRFSEAAPMSQRLVTALQAMDGAREEKEGDEAWQGEFGALSNFLGRQYEAAQRSSHLNWLPPADQREEAWMNFEGVFDEIRTQGPKQHEPQIQALAKAEAVVDSVGDDAKLTAAGIAWVDHVTAMAAKRGEADKLVGEVNYLRADYFYYALVLFIVGFAFVAMTWMAPRSRLVAIPAWIFSGIATVLVIYGITVRSLLRERPPVTTLYETILLITGGAALLALIVEAILPRRIALSVGTVFGAGGMFLAQSYEAHKATDTFEQLQAVLDTNYYLAIHVTTVTYGYAVGLLAGFIGAVYLLAKLIRPSAPYSFYRTIGRIMYGCLCFGVLLSTFGTIMGGVWANDSWGRFWGWDPKENGALMIVLWELLILHARMGGYVRDFGIAMLAVLGNIIIAFSWWGVNLMGVGLHSYGFEAGLQTIVVSFYISQLAIVALGGIAWMLERSRKAALEQARREISGAQAAGAEA